MLSRHASRCRIAIVRPLRPPNTYLGTRFFSQKPENRIAHRTATRPIPPYLSQPPLRPTSSLLGPNPHLARLISTETRQYIGQQFWLATKWTVVIWTVIGLGAISWFGLQIELEERSQPTPDEWRFLTRLYMREGRQQIRLGEAPEKGFVDWAKVASVFKKVVDRLEDRTEEGKGVVDIEEGGIMVEGVGRTGRDVSSKSWPWRAGYHEALMGCAAAAEHLDGMVLDQTRRLVFPAEFVIGPSNPDPRPVPSYMKAAPREEDCIRPFDPPETYYMRILTTTGFTTRQKLDAALAYANWLEFKGLEDSATEMYKWAQDIALAGMISATSQASKGPPQPSRASPNLLRANTALAIHYARTGNVSASLPLLLDTLRQRRSAPVEPLSVEAFSGSSWRDAKTDIGAVLSMFSSIFSSSSALQQPPSGDMPLVKATDKPTCDDSELMLYIGEILFATSPDAAEGLGWTWQAVTIAEANLQGGTHIPAGGDGADDADAARAKCKPCLTTGVNNWEVMLQQLAARQAESSEREGGRDAGFFEWRGWFGKDGGKKGKTLDELGVGVLQEELTKVARLKEKLLQDAANEELAKGHALGALGTFLGRS